MVVKMAGLGRSFGGVDGDPQLGDRPWGEGGPDHGGAGGGRSGVETPGRCWRRRGESWRSRYATIR